MKSTTSITTQKNESICLRGEIHLLVHLLNHSLRVSLEIFRVSLLKSVLLFLINQGARFISRGIDRSYFSENFLLSFLLWYLFKIQVKSRGGGTFFCLVLSVKTFGRSNFFSIES